MRRGVCDGRELLDRAPLSHAPAIGPMLLDPLRAVARARGYALGVHGSLRRDIDIIAAPWTDDAVDARELAEAIRAEAERLTGKTAFYLNDETAKPLDYTRRTPEPKPHGRLGWSIHLAGLNTYIDLSVLAAGQAHVDTKIAELERKLDQAYASIANGRSIDVQHVRQIDDYGCMVACLAMVTGRPYSELRAYFVDLGKTFEGERGGISEYDAESYLADHGYAVGRKYRWRGANIPRPAWPAPAFAPVHILGVRGAGAHGVVLLTDGRVLDPMFDDPRSLADYPEVAYMLGIWKVAR